MAIRVIPPDPNANSTRRRKTNIDRDLVDVNHGGTRSYGPCPHTNPKNANICTGGVSMTALLGPDLGDGLMRGTKTNSNSLQPVMGLLNQRSTKTWIAGHLLNADWGGSGTSDKNLTPLTSAANSAHKIFEAHIKNMLLVCNQLDRASSDIDYWYGVSYDVAVSSTTYASTPDTSDMHCYAYSHITVDYSFVLLPKWPQGGNNHQAPPPPDTSIAVPSTDPNLTKLKNVGPPTFTPSSNIVNYVAHVGGISFSVEIHNEP